MMKLILPLALVALAPWYHVAADDSTTPTAEDGVQRLTVLNTKLANELSKQKTSDTNCNNAVSPVPVSITIGSLSLLDDDSSSDYWMTKLNMTDSDQVLQTFALFNEIIRYYTNITWIWIVIKDESNDFEDSYLDVLNKVMSCMEILSVDYSDPDSAAIIINERATGTITQRSGYEVTPVTSSDIPSDSNKVIFGIFVDFNANWLCKPVTGATVNFSRQDGSTVNLPAITITGKMKYTECKIATVVAIPLSVEGHSICVVKLKDTSDNGINELYEYMAEQSNVDKMIEDLETKEISITGPIVTMMQSYWLDELYWETYPEEAASYSNYSYSGVFAGDTKARFKLLNVALITMNEETTSSGTDEKCTVTDVDACTTIEVNSTTIVYYMYKNCILGTVFVNGYDETA